MFARLRRHYCPDLAIDLGTSNTVIAREGEGVVLREPSVVAVQVESGEVVGRGTAVGRLARQMIGRTPDSITAKYPLTAGVIADFELCRAMLSLFLQKVHRSHPVCRAVGVKPRVVLPIPSGITPVEKQAVFHTADRCTSGQVCLIDSAQAAAIGAGLPIAEPLASFVCDIGAGTTDVGLFSMGDAIASASIRIGGNQLDEAVIEHLKREFALRIGQRTAEDLKFSLGSASPLAQERFEEVGGRDTISGIPRKATVTTEEVRQALLGPLSEIVLGIQSVMERCPPELMTDLSDTGLVLTGGGALLKGLPDYLQDQLGFPVRIADDPLTCVARGAAVAADRLSIWGDALETRDRQHRRRGTLIRGRSPVRS